MEPEEQQMPVDPRALLTQLAQADNIVPSLPEGKAEEIARECLQNYDLDKSSMDEWFETMQRGLDLAQLVKEEKTYPFKGASNIKYPLISSAALQFNARAYPAIVPSDRVVRCKVNGADPQGVKAARAERVSLYQSHQLTNDIEEWEEGTDQLLLQLPIVGHMYRKVWYDRVKARPCSRVIEPGKMIVNDRVKSLDDAPRATEEIPLYPFEIESRIRSGDFVEFEFTTGEDKQEVQDFIEQHCRYDLDNDGYPEPYVATVHCESRKLVRLVADYRVEDVKFQMATQMVQTVVTVPQPITGAPMQVPQMAPQEVAVGVIHIPRHSHFVDYRFWPSMSGGYHGCGLGMLLGDISDSVNSIMNMLMDAGHFASLGGGFIGSEFRVKGGAQRMRPGEWKLTQASGNDVRSSIVPLTFPGPDATLYQMLGMLIEAGREVASVKDIMTGDTGTKNMTATTTLALIEQGMMVFTAAYKRIFRSLRKEYRILARINAETLDPQVYNAFFDEVDQQGQPIMLDPAQDFGAADLDIVPVADPRSVTKQQEFTKAQLVMDMSQMGLVNNVEAAMRILEAADIPDREDLLPQPDPMQQQMAEMQMQAARADLANKLADLDVKLADIEKTRTDAVKNMADIEAQQVQQRLDAVELILKDERDRINAVFRTATQGVARASGNGSNAGPSAAGFGGAGAGNIQPLPGRNGPGAIGAGAAAIPGAASGAGGF